MKCNEDDIQTHSFLWDVRNNSVILGINQDISKTLISHQKLAVPDISQTKDGGDIIQLLIKYLNIHIWYTPPHDMIQVKDLIFHHEGS